VSAAGDGAAMTRAVGQGDVDLVILDLKLAHEDGLALMRALRATSLVPVILVTGHRRDEVDRVLGLELGADDYLTKPLSLRELAARVRAVLRRNEHAHDSAPRRDKAEYRFAGWSLDMATRRLVSPSGRAIALTRGEVALLAALLQSPRRILSREQLLAASRLHGEDVFDRSIDVQILRLRRKLEPDPSHPTLIKTERGAGYLLDAAVDVS
jgi:DNA-binding response OmpR family regulator